MRSSGQYKHAVLAKLAETNPRMGAPIWGLEDLLGLPLRDPAEWPPAVRHAIIEDLLDAGKITQTHRKGQWAIASTYYMLAD